MYLNKTDRVSKSSWPSQLGGSFLDCFELHKSLTNLEEAN